MGCSTSNNHATNLVLRPVQQIQIPRQESFKSPDLTSMPISNCSKGGKVFQFPDRDTQIENTYNSDEETFQNLKILLYPSKERKVKRTTKRAERQFREKTEYGDLTENIIKLEHEKKEDDLAMILESFRHHYVLYKLAGPSLEHIIVNMFYCEQKAGRHIFLQGDKGSCYFVLAKGQVEIIKDDVQIKILEAGQSFGELALLYNQPRKATVKTITDCEFWALDRFTFRKCVQEISEQLYEENRAFIEDIEFFSLMTTHQKDFVAQTILNTQFHPQEFIVTEGEQADTYYIIKSGQVAILKGDIKVNQLGPKESFGEAALFGSSVRMASVLALTDVECITLTRDDLTKILGDRIQQVIFNNAIKWAFERSSVLHKLTSLQQERLIQSQKTSIVKEGQILITSGQQCDSLIIILDGSCGTTRGDLFHKGALIGDIYLLSGNTNRSFEKTFTMKSDGVIAIISFENIQRILKGDLENRISRYKEGHEYKISELHNKQLKTIPRLESLIFVKKIGSGQFGSIYLVADTNNQNSLYALKVIPKAHVFQLNYESQILAEKESLDGLNFPFIAALEGFYVDEYAFYLLTEYITGVELFNLLREVGLIGKSQAQFYVANIVLILEYLHNQHVLHRDLKTENLMVDDEGYLILIDFGNAKRLKATDMKRTKTIIGVPHYVAPEVIIGRPYTFTADLWSLGILLYEFICGALPYGEGTQDPYSIYEEILNKQLQFPLFIRDKAMKKFNEQLLSLTPEIRLGTSYSQLKANKFFDEIDWDLLYDRKLKAPFTIPDEKLLQKKYIDQSIKQGKGIWHEMHTRYFKNRQKIHMDIDEYFQK